MPACPMMQQLAAYRAKAPGGRKDALVLGGGTLRVPTAARVLVAAGPAPEWKDA